MKQKIAIGLVVLLIMGISILTGCSGPIHYHNHRFDNNQPVLSADEYLQLAANSKGVKKERNILQAVDQLIQVHQLARAQRTLTRVHTLTPELLAEKQILSAELQLLHHQPSRAVTSLNEITVKTTTLPPRLQVKYHHLLADAYRAQGDVLSSITEQSDILPLLSESSKKSYLLEIWESLQTLSPNVLQYLQQQAMTQNQRGWLSLALISGRTQLGSAKLLAGVRQWQREFPGHPAQALLTRTISDDAKVPDVPQNIALLLPLQGKLAGKAKAIRNGFFAAYYQTKQRGFAPTITVYNTSHQDINQVYQMAIQKGAHFVVGPLTKHNLAKLVETGEFPVPTLALNTLAPNSRKIPNLYQFGLSPVNEAKQAAAKMWDDRHFRIAMITPRGRWGEQIAEAFAQEWRSFGGQVIAQLNYRHRSHLNKKIRELLNVDQAQQRANDIHYVLREKIRSIPRRREDIGAIFLIASPGQAREILPLLRFYYAGNIPVYAISDTYPGIIKKEVNNDLDGILFDDMPWVLKADSELPSDLVQIRNRVKTLWPSSFSHNIRLYALGVDAYNVIPKLGKLILLPEFGVYGATGMLYLYPNHQLYRKLAWARIREGKPRLISQAY